MNKCFSKNGIEEENTVHFFSQQDFQRNSMSCYCFILSFKDLKPLLNLKQAQPQSKCIKDAFALFSHDTSKLRIWFKEEIHVLLVRDWEFPWKCAIHHRVSQRLLQYAGPQPNTYLLRVSHVRNLCPDISFHSVESIWRTAAVPATVPLILFRAWVKKKYTILTAESIF
jgi:hypothetical protein